MGKSGNSAQLGGPLRRTAVEKGRSSLDFHPSLNSLRLRIKLNLGALAVKAKWAQRATADMRKGSNRETVISAVAMLCHRCRRRHSLFYLEQAAPKHLWQSS